MKKAIILFSGGLDSTTCLGWALNEGYDCMALTADYGQRHRREIEGAKKIAAHYGIRLETVSLALPWLKTSSLVDGDAVLPDEKFENIGSSIPSTYVPGRNLMFLSLAASWADSVNAQAIIAGPNILDYSGYPDCRPDFYNSFAETAKFGTRLGATGKPIEIITPIIKLSKADIVRLAVKLKVPLQFTWSCYAGGKKPCGHCDSCKLRAKGFAEAGVTDPAL